MRIPCDLCRFKGATFRTLDGTICYMCWDKLNVEYTFDEIREMTTENAKKFIAASRIVEEELRENPDESKGKRGRPRVTRDPGTGNVGS
jgi:hypothetical protein